ncbi:MAG TPA: hypothetical protein VMA73_04600 [Streptosporangiaceae bacterium]|nr:hypothetical protein [Streptosporangiaceae bacterium]
MLMPSVLDGVASAAGPELPLVAEPPESAAAELVEVEPSWPEPAEPEAAEPEAAEPEPAVPEGAAAAGLAGPPPADDCPPAAAAPG